MKSVTDKIRHFGDIQLFTVKYIYTVYNPSATDKICENVLIFLYWYQWQCNGYYYHNVQYNDSMIQ